MQVVGAGLWLLPLRVLAIRRVSSPWNSRSTHAPAYVFGCRAFDG